MSRHVVQIASDRYSGAVLGHGFRHRCSGDAAAGYAERDSLTGGQFFNALNSNTPGLEQVRARANASDWTGARRDLYTYVIDKSPAARYCVPYTIVNDKEE
jgi:hypothetical protein